MSNHVLDHEKNLGLGNMRALGSQSEVNDGVVEVCNDSVDHEKNVGLALWRADVSILFKGFLVWNKQQQYVFMRTYKSDRSDWSP